jgi:multidrug efflux system membrane fusion protein
MNDVNSPNHVNSPEQFLRSSDVPTHRRHWIIGGAALAAALICVAAWHFIGNGKGAADGSSPAARAKANALKGAAVGVVAARVADVNVFQNGLGTVTPRAVVTVHTRVDGQLMRVLFKEGQIVKEGDLLAELDPRPYQVQLTQAQGALTRDAALLKNAQIDLTRYKTLITQDSVSQQQVDTQAALVRQDEGTVEADQGQVDSAKLSLIYCRVTSPLTGRVGLRLVDPGNIVHAADTNGLVVITQIQPTTVIFAVPETRLAQIVPRLYGGGTLPVEAWDRDNKVKLASGTLNATDNQIDTTTGTVKLRAEFPNENYQLFPNQFVNARALVDTRHGATVIPPAAVQVGSSGSFVYIVQPDQSVTVRTVTLGPSDGNVVAVEKGISPGDVVVVDGTDRLREGIKVQTVARDAPGAAPASAPSQTSAQSQTKTTTPDAAAHRRHRPSNGTDQPSGG